jgi:hypothetical protein
LNIEYLLFNEFCHFYFYPNVANVGELQSQDVKGEVVVLYFESLTTQNLKLSGVPDVLGRSSKSEAQRVNNMAKSIPSFEFTIWDFQKMVIAMQY